MEIDKEAIMIAGASAGFIAAVLTTVERLLSLRDRFMSEEGSEEADKTKPESEPLVSGPSQRWQFLQRLGPSPSYLLLHEIAVIGATGILLNYIGLLVGLRLESILYLDMVGTAFAAFLLGPWWGAIVALLTNSLVNWLLYPVPGADLLIFPWSLVNMTGGLLWGFMARSAQFRSYLKDGHGSILSHIWFLLQFGLVTACVMSIPGTFVEAALTQTTSIQLNARLLDVIGQAIDHGQIMLQDWFTLLVSVGTAEKIGLGLLNWVETCIRYIPDKTISAAIALIVLKRGFPLFEQELIHGGPTGIPPADNRLAPLLLGLLYAPSFGLLLWAGPYMANRFWPLWSFPWLVVVGGYLALRHWGPSDETVQQARWGRACRYDEILHPIHGQPTYHFCQRLTLSMLIASALFALFMPVILADYSGIAFNFFCVVYGSMLALHITRVTVSQNLSMSNLSNDTTSNGEAPPSKTRRRQTRQADSR